MFGVISLLSCHRTRQPVAAQEANPPQETIRPQPPKVTGGMARDIFFSGYHWLVKDSAGERIGPGPNHFSDSDRNVWVDREGQLHLRISRNERSWNCAEVYSRESFGYGRFVVYLSGRIDRLEPNTVFGLFTWDDKSPRTHNREMDIEFSRWTNLGWNGQFTVSPFHFPQNRHRYSFNLSQADNLTTQIIYWRLDSISFITARGHTPDPSGEEIINSWRYSSPDHIPRPRDLRFRFNHWLYLGIPPADPSEIVVNHFEHVRDEMGLTGGPSQSSPR